MCHTICPINAAVIEYLRKVFESRHEIIDYITVSAINSYSGTPTYQASVCVSQLCVHLEHCQRFYDNAPTQCVLYNATF